MIARDIAPRSARHAPDLVTAYEKRLARRLHAGHAVAYAYARVALREILSALDLHAGDEVVLSPLTCKVVPLSLLALGLKPVYADVSAATLNLDADALTAAVGPNTRAVLFQHTYGMPVGIDAVARVAAKHDLPLIEDCAQCLPLVTDDFLPGTRGRAAVFSNNFGKPLPAGSGGLAVTNDNALARTLRETRQRLPKSAGHASLAARAEAWIHNHVLRPSLYWLLFDSARRWGASYKVRPLDVEIAHEIEDQAVQVGEGQVQRGLRWMDRLDAVARHRRRCCDAYADALPGVAGIDLIDLATPAPLYYFPVLVQRKDALLHTARRQRLELIPWPLRTPIYPLVDEAALPAYGYQPGACPVAEDIARRLVGLPTHPRVQQPHRDALINLLKSHHGDSDHR